MNVGDSINPLSEYREEQRGGINQKDEAGEMEARLAEIRNGIEEKQAKKAAEDDYQIRATALSEAVKLVSTGQTSYNAVDNAKIFYKFLTGNL